MRETKTPPPLPSEGGSYELVGGVWVKIPEAEQQVHPAKAATTGTPKTKGKE